jgi:hypothetical protein
MTSRAQSILAALSQLARNLQSYSDDPRHASEPKQKQSTGSGNDVVEEWLSRLGGARELLEGGTRACEWMVRLVAVKIKELSMSILAFKYSAAVEPLF